MKIFKVIKSCLSGNTLTRTLFNLHYEDYRIEGKVLDAGAKSRYINYYDFINHEEANITFTDLKKNEKGFIAMDFKNHFLLLLMSLITYY